MPIHVNASTAKGRYRYPMIRLPLEYAYLIDGTVEIEARDNPSGEVLLHVVQPVVQLHLKQQLRNREWKASDSEEGTLRRGIEPPRGKTPHRLSRPAPFR